jgi:hypothetical protein
MKLDNITAKLLQLIDWVENRYRIAEIAPESEQQANAIYAALGIFSTVILAAAFFSWAPVGTSYWPFLECLSLGVYLHLFIWVLISKGEPYSRALLISLFSLIPLSLIPPQQGPIALAILNALFIFYFIFKKTPSFLQNTKNIKFIAFFAALFSVVIFAATSSDVGDALVAEKFRQLSLNPETLYQVALATMVKNYSAISTGLNGLVRLHHPILSNFIYARVANMMNIEVYEVYGLANFIVFAPLMVLSWIRFCGEMTPKLGQFILLSVLLFFLAVLSQCFGWQGQGYFRDESYLMALVLLPGALSALAPIVRKDGQNQLRNWFTLWMYLPFLSLAQVPVGLGFFLITAYFLLVRSLYSWGSRLGYLVPTAALWYMGDYGARTTGFTSKFKWGVFQDAIADDNIIHFILTQFAFFFLLVPIFSYKPIRSLLNRELRIWLEFFFIFVIMAFFGAQFTTETSGYYFVNPHVFFAIPVLLLIFSSADFRSRFSRESAPFVFNYYRIIVAFLVFSGLFFITQIIPVKYEKTEQIKKNVLAHMGSDFKYLKLFKLIHDDPEQSYLVYVPKSETAFWNNTDDTYSPSAASQCIKMPFYLTIATGKPAIFGLPDPDRHCETSRFGYESYSPLEFKESASTDYDLKSMCHAVLAKGFYGYYRVTLADGVSKERCR